MNDTGEIRLIPTVSRGKLTSAQIRCAAADEIEKRGWTQNQYVSSEGAVCLAGAIYTVIYDIPDPNPTDFAFSHPMYKTIPVFNEVAEIVGTEFVSGWNDKPERTETEVIEALRKDC